jgi:splicing factor 3A subunit 2
MGVPKKQFIKIGRPGYNIKKIRDPNTNQLGLLFQIQLPEIAPGVKPIKRFMSSFEQRKEPINRSIQYFMVAAEPYETIAFAIPAREIVDVEEDPESTWEFWDPDTKSVPKQELTRER